MHANLTASLLATALTAAIIPTADAQERVELFGLQLGAPPTLKICNSPLHDLRMQSDQGPCIQSAPEAGKAWNQHLARIPTSMQPEWMAGPIFVYESVGESVETVSIATKGSSVQEQVAAILRGKFGRGVEARSTVKTRAGVELERLSIQWTIDDVQVTFVGISGTADSGRILATTARGRQATADREAQREAGKAKL